MQALKAFGAQRAPWCAPRDPQDSQLSLAMDSLYSQGARPTHLLAGIGQPSTTNAAQ